MILNSTRKLQIVLTAGATTNNMPVVVDYTDHVGMGTTPDTFVSSTNGTTPVDIAFAPPPGVKRQIDLIQVYQRDTAAKTAQISIVTNGVVSQMTDVVMQPDDVLIYTEATGLKVVDGTGNTKQNTSTATNLVSVSSQSLSSSTEAFLRGTLSVAQVTPTAKTVSATLTAAEVITGIITVAQGAGAPSAQQLPLATAMDTALPNFTTNDAFDFSVINISAVAAETASVTTNTGWTLVGNMLLAANTAVTDNSQGRFRARKTGVGTWTLYRIS